MYLYIVMRVPSTLVGILLAATMLVSFGNIDERSMAVHVDGLNTTLRDQLMVEVALDQHLQIAYACVPAGILVFNATDNRTESTLRAEVTQLISIRSQGTILFLGPPRLEELQAQCASYR